MTRLIMGIAGMAMITFGFGEDFMSLYVIGVLIITYVIITVDTKPVEEEAPEPLEDWQVAQRKHARYKRVIRCSIGCGSFQVGRFCRR